VVIHYTESLDGIKTWQLDGFFVGWPHAPSPEMHLRLLSGSDHVVLAVDMGSGQVVGYVTALTDGVLSSFIPLLEVLPRLSGSGHWPGVDVTHPPPARSSAERRSDVRSQCRALLRTLRYEAVRRYGVAAADGIITNPESPPPQPFVSGKGD
jgi:hypothetical protein